MASTQEKDKRSADANEATTKPDSRSPKIDRMAPAGSKNSLGEESVRDGRPNTDDEVEEAIDEEGPGITNALEDDKPSR